MIAITVTTRLARITFYYEGRIELNTDDRFGQLRVLRVHASRLKTFPDQLASCGETWDVFDLTRDDQTITVEGI
jgi:hypothetical protein